MTTLEITNKEKEMNELVTKGDFAGAARIKAELDAAKAISGVIIPDDIVDVQCGDTFGGWRPDHALAACSPVVKSIIKKSKKGSDALDYRLELDHGGGVILKAYSSTMKAWWKSAGFDPQTLFEKVNGIMTLRPDFMVEWKENTGSDAKDFPFRAVASKR